MALTKITPQMFDTSATAHDLNVDNGTFVVDGSASRVGIGTPTPSTLLDVNGVLTATSIAGTLTTAAQTNITSLGTLTGLTSSGSIQTTGSTTRFISNSSSSGDYIRIYAGSGTGKWDIYGNGANLRFSDNDGAGGVYFDREIGIRNAPDSNYALKLLQNQSLTHGGYFQINGGSAIGLEINATSGSYSGTALYVRESSVTTGGYLARFANSAGDKVTIATDGTATFAGTGTFAGGSTNNNDDANILTLNASQHARLLVDTSSTGGHRATLALESNGNELTLANTG